MKSFKRYVEVGVFWVLPVSIMAFIAVEVIVWLAQLVRT